MNDGRPRLAMVSTWPPFFSGVSDYSVRLAEQLSATFQIDVIHERGVECELPDSLSNVLRLEHRRFAWRNSRYDAVHYQIGNNVNHDFIVPLLTRIPGVVTLHDTDISGLWACSNGRGSKWVRRLSSWQDARRLITSKATEVVVHSPSNLAELGSGGGETIPLGAQPFRLSPDVLSRVRERYGIPRNALVIGVAGMVTPSKMVIEAYEAFRSAHLPPDAMLVFFGPELDGGHLRRLVAEVDITGQVRCLGSLPSRDDFGDLCAACDIGLALRRPPTHGETSAALLDFLRGGVACAASDVGTFRDFPNSILVKITPDSGVPGIARALERLASDPGLRSQLGRAAIVHIREHHDWTRVAARYTELFHRAARTTPAIPLVERTIRWAAKALERKVS